jgi:urea transport system substrate-binding protein
MTVRMDPENHHLHKPFFIGEVQADGQFAVVFKSPALITPQPWSPFLAR